MRRIRLALPLAFVLFLADCSTKELAVEHLSPAHVPHPIVGDYLQFTLAYNDAAAMSIPVGPYGRWILIGFGLTVVTVLLRMAWTTPRDAKAQHIALGLLLGGALGNVTSRIFSERGVVDFIDVGIGDWRFYLFNVADVWLALGVCMFAFILHRAERRSRAPDPVA